MVVRCGLFNAALFWQRRCLRGRQVSIWRHAAGRGSG
jgi:hypothetical protein